MANAADKHPLECLTRGGQPISRFGLSLHGIAFLIFGGLLIIAAWHADHEKAEGPSVALMTLQQQPYGWFLLGVMAIGSIAVATYSLIGSVGPSHSRSGGLT